MAHPSGQCCPLPCMSVSLVVSPCCFSLYVCLSVCRSVCLSVSLSPSVCLPVCQQIGLSVCLSVCQSVNLPVCVCMGLCNIGHDRYVPQILLQSPDLLVCISTAYRKSCMPVDHNADAKTHCLASPAARTYLNKFTVVMFYCPFSKASAHADYSVTARWSCRDSLLQ